MYHGLTSKHAHICRTDFFHSIVHLSSCFPSDTRTFVSMFYEKRLTFVSCFNLKTRSHLSHLSSSVPSYFCLPVSPVPADICLPFRHRVSCRSGCRSGIRFRHPSGAGFDVLFRVMTAPVRRPFKGLFGIFITFFL